MKLLCLHPYVQFLGYALGCAPMCPVVMGSSSYYAVCSFYECCVDSGVSRQGLALPTSSTNWAELSRFLPEDGHKVQSMKRCF
jgi:hypothetical protein